MSKQCTTHHHACDCREKEIMALLYTYMGEHTMQMRVDIPTTTITGENCGCETCCRARKLLGKEKEE